MRTFGCVACDAVRRIAWITSVGAQVGRACIRHAARPATSGAANEVPLFAEYAFGSPNAFTIGFATPRAARSGFTRPSALGPYDENPATNPDSSTAPAAIRLSPFTSAGAIR